MSGPRYPCDVEGEADQIPDITAHPDAEALLTYDHPTMTLISWRAVLTAKAWLGDELGCFFVDAEHEAMRLLLIFNADRSFQAEAGSIDMRSAVPGEMYELEVACGARPRPVVLRADRLR